MDLCGEIQKRAAMVLTKCDDIAAQNAAPAKVKITHAFAPLQKPGQPRCKHTPVVFKVCHGKIVLGGVPLVERGFGHARFFNNLVHTGVRIALPVEKSDCSPQDLVLRLAFFSAGRGLSLDFWSTTQLALVLLTKPDRLVCFMRGAGNFKQKPKKAQGRTYGDCVHF